MRVVLLLAMGTTIAAILAGCGAEAPRNLSSVTLTMAPPGPADLGPATGLSTAPDGAIVFDLKYRPQRGGDDDIPYYSFWGYGGSDEEANNDPFLTAVRKQSPKAKSVQNPMFKGRQWAAVEMQSKAPVALYFDLNANGKLDPGEKIPPTRKTDEDFEFITPDFTNPNDGRGETLCRALLRVNFYGDGSEPNFMWSPAALMEGSVTLNGEAATLLLYASRPGGPYDHYGSSWQALVVGDRSRNLGGQHISHDTLSSLLSHEEQFYHLAIEGVRSNGLPARALLVKDTTPTGELALKLAGSNTVSASINSMYLRGIDETNVHLRLGAAAGSVKLPIGAYRVTSGTIRYGTSKDPDWEVSFSNGPRANLKTGETTTVTLGHPALAVRAVKEDERYNQNAKESAVFKKGSRIYLEPRIVGRGQETFTRFEKLAATGRNQNTPRPPKITIASADGKQVLSKTMEYG